MLESLWVSGRKRGIWLHGDSKHTVLQIFLTRWAQETIDNKIYVSKGLITNSEWVEGKVLQPVNNLTCLRAQLRALTWFRKLKFHSDQTIEKILDIQVHKLRTNYWLWNICNEYEEILLALTPSQTLPIPLSMPYELSFPVHLQKFFLNGCTSL